MAYRRSLPLFVAGRFMAGAAPAVAVANDAVALGFDPARLSRHLLNPKTVELMHANHTGDKYRRDTTAFGLGFWVNEDSGFYGELVNKGAHGWGSANFPSTLSTRKRTWLRSS